MNKVSLVQQALLRKGRHRLGLVMLTFNPSPVGAKARGSVSSSQPGLQNEFQERQGLSQKVNKQTKTKGKKKAEMT